MPETPFPPKARRPVPGVTATAGNGPAYAELHCRTNYSFLEGASHPDELVSRAAALGHSALAITDQNTLAGIVRAHVAAKAANLKLIIGAEITPLDSPPLVLWAMHRLGYGRLSRLITLGRRRAVKGECLLTRDDVAASSEGLLAGVVLRPEVLPDSALDLARWREIFGDRCYGLVEMPLGPAWQWLVSITPELRRESGVTLAAANDVHYHVRTRRYLHDVLTAIRYGTPVSELEPDLLFSNGERYLKSPAQMRALFASAPELIDATQEISGRCHFSLDELKYDYPEELCPAGETLRSYLTKLTWAGANDRYPQGVPDKVRQLLEHELQLISDLHYEAYFLTVWDLVRFARSRGILCQGRGSAANSAVCYCLQITSVDPEKSNLLFERFISRERDEAPDIDVDFEHERREEVLQYVYEKYGRDRVGMTAEVITYRPRSATRDVGKALGLSLDRVDALAKSVDHVDGSEQLAARYREVGFNVTNRIGRQLIYLVCEIIGFPRHLSQHVGGMVLTQSPLCELVPIENAAMPGRTVIEWDKDDLDALGILKVDCLALGMLSAIRRSFELLQRHKQLPLTLATVPPEDPATYRMIQRADTVGVFQIESRAQMSMLPRLKPNCFYDLVIEVAIVRPGPIQGDMVHPYLRRRTGQEPITYPNAEVERVLSRTLGVPLFQEQAMKLAEVAAGFTPGEADQLRRAMGAWRKTGVMEQFRQKFRTGMLARGYDSEFAERLYNQIRGFGEYGFPESHAASFALLVYASAWIKCFHPDVFLAALLNSQPMGFYAPAQLIADARKHGVEVRPVDVNHSDWDCTLEPASPSYPSGSSRSDARPSHAVRMGWCLIRSAGESLARTILDGRSQGPFTTWADFVHRTGLSSAQLTTLARADAFQSLGISRRDAQWLALPAHRRNGSPRAGSTRARRETPSLFDGIDQDPTAPLPQMTPQSEVVADYRAGGYSLRDHPVKFLRDRLTERRVITTASLAAVEPDRRYRVAGLVLIRQRPSTARGITFMTLEDETGTANLIVHPGTWERFHSIARRSGALIAEGTLQRQDGIIHLIVEKLEDLSQDLTEVPNRSRDFR